MKDISKEKLYGIAGTVLFHLVVLILLYFIVMEQIPVQPEKSNIEMQSAVEDFAGEEFFEAKMMTDVQPQVSKSDPAPEAPAKDPLIAQNYEESVPVDTLDSKKKQEKPKPVVSEEEKRRKEEAERLAAEEAKRIYGESVPLDAGLNGKGFFAFTQRLPLGVVAAITPFNYPLNLTIHKIAPAIACKNTVIVKPPTEAPLAVMKFCELLDEEFPDGVVNVVTGYGSEIGDYLVCSSEVDKISFTGSVTTGMMISQKAGMKKVTLELGGNDPVIILKDADLDKARKILRNDFENDLETIDKDILKKYINFAKNNIFPVLSDEAIEYISVFYAKTRRMSAMEEDIGKPITMRELNAIKRLATARAKVELRDVVTIDDAEVDTLYVAPKNPEE